MKHTATIQRKHEVEQALACANNLLVGCIKLNRCTRHLSEIKHLISDIYTVRYDMLNDLDYDQTTRVKDIELRIRSLMPTEFTPDPREPAGPP